MSNLTQNLGKRKIAILIICLLLIVVTTTYFLFKNISADKAKVPDVAGYQEVASDVPKNLEPMVMGSVADIVKKNNPESTNFSAIAPKIRDGSYTKTPPNSDGIIQAKFFVDIESLKQSYAVYVSYYKDTSDKFAGPPSVRCIENKDDLIYGEFDCKEISPTNDQSSTDPLLSKLPYKDPFYYISGYIDSKGSKHVVVDIDLNTFSAATQKVFQEREGQSLEWIKSQNVDPNKYFIEWRNLRRDVIERNNTAS